MTTIMQGSCKMHDKAVELLLLYHSIAVGPLPARQVMLLLLLLLLECYNDHLQM